MKGYRFCLLLLLCVLLISAAADILLKTSAAGMEEELLEIAYMAKRGQWAEAAKKHKELSEKFEALLPVYSVFTYDSMLQDISEQFLITAHELGSRDLVKYGRENDVLIARLHYTAQHGSISLRIVT